MILSARQKKATFYVIAYLPKYSSIRVDSRQIKREKMVKLSMEISTECSWNIYTSKNTEIPPKWSSKLKKKVWIQRIQNEYIFEWSVTAGKK